MFIFDACNIDLKSSHSSLHARPLFLSRFVVFCFIRDLRLRKPTEVAETEASTFIASGRFPLPHLPLQFGGQGSKRRWRTVHVYPTIRSIE